MQILLSQSNPSTQSLLDVHAPPMGTKQTLSTTTKSDLHGAFPPGPDKRVEVHAPLMQAVASDEQSDKVVHEPPIGTLHTELEQTRLLAHSLVLEHVDPKGLFTTVLPVKKNTKTIIKIIINIIINIIIPIVWFVMLFLYAHNFYITIFVH